MTGFEPGSSGIGSNHSANCATTTAQLTLFTHFKTNTKYIDVYTVLRCSELVKKSKHSESLEMG